MSDGASPATARPVRGTKISPMPMPRRIIGQKRSTCPVSSVKCECIRIERKKSTTPVKMIGRTSTLFAIRPATAIVTAVAMAPGRSTRPVSHALKPR